MNSSSNYLRRLESSAQKTARAMVGGGVRVVTAGRGACYAWKENVIYVPPYSPREGDDPRLGWAFRGTLDHEMAHVAYTDFELLDAAIELWKQAREKGEAVHLMGLMNVFEDVFIERTWMNDNEGSKKYIETKTDFVIEDTDGAAICDPMYIIPDSNPPKPIGMFGAFAQAILRVQSGRIQFEECAMDVQMLMLMCEEEIAQGFAADSTAESIAAAEVLWDRLKEISDTDPSEGEGEGEGGGEGEGEPGEGGESGGSGGSTSGKGDNKGDNSSEGENDDGEGGSGGGKDKGDESGGGSGGGEEEADKGEEKSGEGEGGSGGGEEAEGDSASGGGGTGSGPAEGQQDGSHSGKPTTVSKELKGVAWELVNGEWGEVPTDSEIVAAKFLNDPERRPYLIDPEAKQMDRWEIPHQKLTGEQRVDRLAQLEMLRDSAGPAAQYLSSLLRRSIRAMQETLVVGGLDDGRDLDIDALAGLALGHNDPRIFSDLFKRLEENTYVEILVDCSGSMGRGGAVKYCPQHGTVNQKDNKCTRRDGGTTRCGKTLRSRVESKAGYAALTATALHDALRLCGIPHSVLGYTNEHPDYGWWERKPKGYYSRYTTALVTYEFVSAPGVHDNGIGLTYIDGIGANLDGESVEAAAMHAAQNAGDADRIILMVIADGLPAGADDGEIEDRHLKDTVELVAQAGIEVYGIGVGIYEQERFKSYYPERPMIGNRAATGSVIIPNGKGLSKTVLMQLTSLLIKSTGWSRGRRAS